MKSMKIKHMLCVAVASLPLWASAAGAVNYVGKYHGDKISMEVNVDDFGSYIGTIHMGGKNFPMTGQAIGDHLQGKFSSGGTSFDFTAKLNGDILSLTTGSVTYTVSRGD